MNTQSDLCIQVIPQLLARFEGVLYLLDQLKEAGVTSQAVADFERGMRELIPFKDAAIDDLNERCFSMKAEDDLRLDGSVYINVTPARDLSFAVPFTPAVHVLLNRFRGLGAVELEPLQTVPMSFGRTGMMIWWGGQELDPEHQIVVEDARGPELKALLGEFASQPGVQFGECKYRPDQDQKG